MKNDAKRLKALSKLREKANSLIVLDHAKHLPVEEKEQRIEDLVIELLDVMDEVRKILEKKL